MIKRLIFDFDDTLIEWKKEYNNMISKALDEVGYDYDETLPEKIKQTELKYEIDRKYFNRKEMLEFFNKNLNIKLPENFIDVWIEKQCNCVPERLEESVYSTLEYLKRNYQLVILTNWFRESQVARLKKVNIYKYFDEIYDAEKYAKPYKESFIQAIGNNNINECAMIGDNLISDIKAAKNIGINKLVWIDNQNKRNDLNNELNGIDVINDISDLKKIF